MAVVWQLQLIQFREHHEVSGVLLESVPPEPSDSPLLNALRVTATYFIRPYAGKHIRLSMGSESHQVTTNRSGGFFYRGIGVAHTQPRIFDGDSEIQVSQRYPMVFPYEPAGLGVISDVDDTVIRSYSAHMFRRMYTTLFTTTRRRKGIEYVTSIYRLLEKHGVPVCYVSKSESNLFDVITSVFQLLEVPAGPFFLTPFLNFSGLFRAKPGEHKLRCIRTVLHGYPERQFLLFGDDTQHDMQIYRTIIEEFPGRIVKVYIHRTRQMLAADKEAAFNSLKATDVPVIYFDQSDHIREEIDSLVRHTHS